MTLYRNVLEFTDDALNALNDMLQSYSLQLFALPAKGKYPIPFATSVLVEAHGVRFLLTAAHVLCRETKSDVLFIDVEGKAWKLGGKAVASVLTASQINMQTDISVLKLDSKTIALLEKMGKSFYSIAEQNHDLRQESGTILYLYGFPYRRTRLNKQKATTTTMPFNFVSGVTEQSVKEFNPSIQMKVAYTKNRIASLVSPDTHRGPQQEGMSGSGIWQLTSPFGSPSGQSGDPTFVLAGIYTEYRRDLSVILGTRVHVITEIMRTKFNIPMPKSRLHPTK